MGELESPKPQLADAEVERAIVGAIRDLGSNATQVSIIRRAGCGRNRALRALRSLVEQGRVKAKDVRSGDVVLVRLYEADGEKRAAWRVGE